jgi:chromosomal replication initiation ATPase DnaA
LAEQLRLGLRAPQRLRRESFLVSDCNAEAAGRLDAWPAWTAPVLALVGPAGSGKSHLAHAWAARARARVIGLEDLELAVDGPLVIEGADRRQAREPLFHLLNRTTDTAHAVLFTARARPADWACALPDLRSRLNALPVVELGHPDDGVLRSALLRLFDERVLTPSPELVTYLVARMERSVPAAVALVDRLEAAHVEQRRPLNRALARELLAGEAAHRPLDGEEVAS